MKIRSKTVSGVLAGCAAFAFAAVPASAAQVEGPATATTDAGTTCTVVADATVGGGLGVKPVGFSGSIDCTLADPSNAPASGGGLVLQSSAPLGLGSMGGTPSDPGAQEQVAPPPGFGSEVGPGYRCDVEPGVDCGFSGRQPLGLLGQTYTALFGTAITPPEGERFVSTSDGCTLQEDGTAGCASEKSVTVR